MAATKAMATEMVDKAYMPGMAESKKANTITPDYFENIRKIRILETVCPNFTEETRYCFGREVEPCQVRCSLEDGNDKCKYNWNK